MATADTQRMTLREFSALPEGPPNFEFEDGEVIRVPSPTVDHQDVVQELGHKVWQHARQRRLGRACMGVDVYLPDGRVFIPDVSYLSREHLHLLSAEDQKIHGVPDLVVEVTSSDPDRDRVHKFRVYFENGVPWYWIVDGETLAIEEYRATPEGYHRVASVAGGEDFRPRLFTELVINLAQLLGLNASPPASSSPGD